jgi:phosphomannomutase/phosphoglucomutase
MSRTVVNVSPIIFRQYDIRGVVNRDLSPDVARAIGRAVGTLAWDRVDHPPRLAVGRDNRSSGESLSAGVREGIVAAGGTAVDVGMLPTPALYLALHELQVDGGIQVTGSHNPPEFNGFKMVVAGSTIYGDDIQLLRRMIEEGRMREGTGAIESDDSVLRRYADAIATRNGPLARAVRVVVDCGNGVTSLVAASTLSRIGAEVVPLYCESDGTFPNHHPDPTVLENLRELGEVVRRENAELGIAFDGDGDRIGAVNERGEVVYGDLLLILFGRDLVDRMGSGHHVIFDVKCSNVLGEQLRLAGLEPTIWKTGHSLIKAKMKEVGAPLAGEMSGHMFFGGDYYGFDDALFAAARLLAFLARRGGPLSRQLADVPDTFATPEIRVECSEEEKFAIVEAAAHEFASRYDVLTLDGVRISFPTGWGLLRASNTQPVLVLRFEAGSEADLQQYREEVEGWLRGRGVTV